MYGGELWGDCVSLFKPWLTGIVTAKLYQWCNLISPPWIVLCTALNSLHCGRPSHDQWKQCNRVPLLFCSFYPLCYNHYLVYHTIVLTEGCLLFWLLVIWIFCQSGVYELDEQLVKVRQEANGTIVFSDFLYCFFVKQNVIQLLE